MTCTQPPWQATSIVIGVVSHKKTRNLLHNSESSLTVSVLTKCNQKPRDQMSSYISSSRYTINCLVNYFWSEKNCRPRIFLEIVYISYIVRHRLKEQCHYLNKISSWVINWMIYLQHFTKKRETYYTEHVKTLQTSFKKATWSRPSWGCVDLLKKKSSVTIYWKTFTK